MGTIKIILGLAVLLLLAVGWQFGSRELANIELQDEMHDLASQAGTRVGLVAPNSDDDLRGAVVRKAKQHDIELQPEQVTVQRTGSEDKQTLYLAANYTVPIVLPGFSFALHFTASSGKN
jgi:hypothetical protein